MITTSVGLGKSSDGENSLFFGSVYVLQSLGIYLDLLKLTFLNPLLISLNF